MKLTPASPPKAQLDLNKLDDILRWLNPFICMTKHWDTLSQRQSDTCTWFLRTDECKAWLAGEDSFLWLQGKAGAGKTVLVASVIEHLEQTLVDEPLAFFYCDFGQQEATDATQVMRSVLYQLLDRYRDCRVKPEARQVVDELVRESRKGDAALQNTMRLSTLVSRVAGQFCRRPAIIIDALDECREVAHLLHALRGLTAENVRLLVTSRSIQAIKYKFSELPSVSMDKMADAVSADIEMHVNREVDSHPRLGSLDSMLKREVCSTLCRKADGMFRWVQCQLDALKKCVTPKEFQETLSSLPIGLDATYERILLGIDRQTSEGKVARRALAWLVTASRPLVLNEMVEALSIDLQKRKLDPAIAPVNKHTLLDVLRSLVVHNEETDIISLSHFSVKEYLMKELTRIKLPDYHINLKEAHKQVFQLCMCYLAVSLIPLSDNGRAPRSMEQGAVMLDSIPSRPLLDYVLSCSFDHLTHLEPTDEVILDSMVAVQSEIQNRPLEWSHICGSAISYEQYKLWITPEHDFIVCVLISMLPEPFLRAFLSRAAPTPKYGSNPLVHTVQFNKVNHAKTLLSKGIDVDSSGCENISGVVERAVPLVAALRRGNDVLVELFLKEGSASIPRQVYSTLFKEDHCEYAPHLVSSLLQADEFVEWAAEIQDVDILLRPLYPRRYQEGNMTETDLLIAMRRLVQIGVDMSSEKFLLMVASAVSNGHLPLLEYLFCIHAPIPSGILITEETVPLVRDLMLRGIDIQAITAKGDTVLHQILGRCSQCLSCWVLDCDRCSDHRFRLLTTLGREEEKTLIKIIAISQSLRCKFLNLDFTSSGGHHNPEITRFLYQLRKICLASGTLLQAINRSFLDNTIPDYYSNCWLRGNLEAKACAEILQQMETLAKIDSPTPSAGIQNIISLFDKQQSHFRFLLKDDVEQVFKMHDKTPLTALPRDSNTNGEPSLKLLLLPPLPPPGSGPLTPSLPGPSLSLHRSAATSRSAAPQPITSQSATPGPQRDPPPPSLSPPSSSPQDPRPSCLQFLRLQFLRLKLLRLKLSCLRPPHSPSSPLPQAGPPPPGQQCLPPKKDPLLKIRDSPPPVPSSPSQSPPSPPPQGPPFEVLQNEGLPPPRPSPQDQDCLNAQSPNSRGTQLYSQRCRDSLPWIEESLPPDLSSPSPPPQDPSSEDLQYQGLSPPSPSPQDQQRLDASPPDSRPPSPRLPWLQHRDPPLGVPSHSDSRRSEKTPRIHQDPRRRDPPPPSPSLPGPPPQVPSRLPRRRKGLSCLQPPYSPSSPPPGPPPQVPASASLPRPTQEKSQALRRRKSPPSDPPPDPSPPSPSPPSSTRDSLPSDLPLQDPLPRGPPPCLPLPPPSSPDPRRLDAPLLDSQPSPPSHCESQPSKKSPRKRHQDPRRRDSPPLSPSLPGSYLARKKSQAPRPPPDSSPPSPSPQDPSSEDLQYQGLSPPSPSPQAQERLDAPPPDSRPPSPRFPRLQYQDSPLGDLSDSRPSEQIPRKRHQDPRRRAPPPPSRSISSPPPQISPPLPLRRKDPSPPGRSMVVDLSRAKINVVLVGQTGVGKSTVINMIMGIPDHSKAAALVGRSARVVTKHNACYSCVLTSGLRCELWDTRGLDAATDEDVNVTTGDHLIAKRAEQIPCLPSGSILMWCIQATKIDFPSSWQQFRKVYEEYCNVGRGPVPMIVITQIASSETGWEPKCRDQIRQLGPRVGRHDIDDVLLLRVRRHRGASSAEYIEDSRALRDHISRLACDLTVNVYSPTNVAG